MGAPFHQNWAYKRASAIIQAYYAHLNRDIAQNGYCTEMLGGSDDYRQTRLLCQSRCMYFLVEYSLLYPDSKAWKQALTLYHLIKQDYCSHSGWLQYPGGALLTDLYEYAFLMFSIAKLESVQSSPMFQKDLNHLNSIIQNHYFSPEKAFANLQDEAGFVSQNALMHLFESYLEMYKVMPKRYAEQALTQLAGSMAQLFYDADRHLISEYAPFGDANTIYEPGHTFEWCCLLVEAQHYGFEKPEPIDIAFMVDAAENEGINARAIVVPSIPLPSSLRYRIWPTLERMRYYALIKDDNAVCRLFSHFDEVFIDPISHLPIEYVDKHFKPDFSGIKTTTSYHLINCLKHLIAGESNIR